jgi:hypothetical protein
LARPGGDRPSAVTGGGVPAAAPRGALAHLASLVGAISAAFLVRAELRSSPELERAKVVVTDAEHLPALRSAVAREPTMRRRRRERNGGARSIDRRARSFAVRRHFAR